MNPRPPDFVFLAALLGDERPSANSIARLDDGYAQPSRSQFASGGETRESCADYYDVVFVVRQQRFFQGRRRGQTVSRGASASDAESV
jgi:hypothetical protein